MMPNFLIKALLLVFFVYPKRPAGKEGRRSVDCSTEGVLFREGTSGGAGESVSVPVPGFPFLSPATSYQCPFTSLLGLPKQKPARLSTQEVAGCATGSARPLQAPIFGSRLPSL
jgi:hypothetical protein